MSDNSHEVENDVAAQLEQLKLASLSTDQPSGGNTNDVIKQPEIFVSIETVSSTVNNQSNNQRIPHERAQNANRHRVVIEPEGQAVLGNNLIDRKDEEDDESTLQEDVIMNDYELNSEEEADKNKTETDANNIGDVSLLRPPEASFYSVLDIEIPILKAEIKFRILNDIELDEYARNELYEKHMKDWNLPGSENAAKNRAPKKVLVLNGYYYVNEKNTEILAEYWDNDTIEIGRHTHFGKGDKLLDKKLQQAIRVFLKKGKETADIKFNIHSANELVVTEKGKQPKIVTFYSQPAKWEDQYSKITHLMFVVHGVGHLGDEDGVVNITKSIIKGVESLKGTSSGMLSIPIHWRNPIRRQQGHTCDESCSQEHDFWIKLFNFFFSDDVALYTCTETGRQIREVVICNMNLRYKQFITNNAGFTGTVGIFGHSLGSVISYDILTKFEGVTLSKQDTPRIELDCFDKVKCLYTVGSPLKRCINQREERAIELKRKLPISHQMEMKESPVEQFRLVHSSSSFRIFNIYHQTDLVAYCLEPLIQDLRYRIDYLVSNDFYKPHVCYPYLPDVHELLIHFFEEVKVAADECSEQPG
ncbi:unnamed protein product [Caenorhabditis brenneri]